MAEVNGLVLPASLLGAVAAGRWPPAAAAETLNAVFPEEAVWPQFFTVEEIAAVNRSWGAETRPEFVGSPGSRDGVRTDRSLLIGQLGPDQLVALSYASSDDREPSVVYLTADPGGRWVHVAAGVDDLLQRLDAARSAR